MLASSGEFRGQRRLAGSVLTTSHAILKKADSRDHPDALSPLVSLSGLAMVLRWCCAYR